MPTKETIDSKDSKRGDYYQQLVAIKFAMSEKLKDFKLLTFEHFGDVSFDDIIQIECKHHKNKSSLADTSEDFWKTLHNCIFLSKSFKQYVLFTTEHFPKNKKQPSYLSKWNKAKEFEKIKILKNIKFLYSLDNIKDYKIFDKNLKIISNCEVSDTTICNLEKYKNKKYIEPEFKKLLNDLSISEKEQKILLIELKDTSDKKYDVWNYNRIILKIPETKLIQFIEKMVIKTEQQIDDELIDELTTFPLFRETPCKSIDDLKKIIKDAAGILSSKVTGKEKFEYSNKEFYNVITQGKKDFYNSYYRPIFEEYRTKKEPDNILQIYENKKFVKEMTTIDCKEEEITGAMVDYWKTVTLIDTEENNSPGFVKQEYIPYKNTEVYKKLKTKKNVYEKSDKEEENLKRSKTFYRDARQIQIRDDNSIKSYDYFVHGTMQNIVEDKELNFSWIL